MILLRCVFQTVSVPEDAIPATLICNTPFPDDTYMNITWNLQFSSVSAGRVSLVDHFLPPPVMKSQINATERDLLIAHDTWEQHGKSAVHDATTGNSSFCHISFLAGLMGHRTEGAHPWTRFLTAVLV